MKIAIFGSGNVGSNLAKGWLAAGHEVMFGSRDPNSDHMQQVLAGVGGRANDYAGALAFADVAVLAVPYQALPDVTQRSGDWTHKIVVDTVNRFTGRSNQSAAEDLAAMIPNARIVKAFNSIGAELLSNPKFGDVGATMFICGNETEAKDVVTQLGEDLGFEVVDAGPLINAGMLEDLTKLWISLSRVYGREIGFKLLRR